MADLNSLAETAENQKSGKQEKLAKKKVSDQKVSQEQSGQPEDQKNNTSVSKDNPIVEIEVDKKSDKKEMEEEGEDLEEVELKEVVFTKQQSDTVEEAKTNKRSKSDGDKDLVDDNNDDEAEKEKQRNIENSVRSTRHLLFSNTGNKNAETLIALCYRICRMKPMMRDLSWLGYSVPQGAVWLRYDSAVRIEKKDLTVLNCYRKSVPPVERNLQLKDYSSKKYQRLYDLKIHYISPSEKNKKSRSEIKQDALKRKNHPSNLDDQGGQAQGQGQGQGSEPEYNTGYGSPAYNFAGSENAFPQLTHHVPILPRPTFQPGFQPGYSLEAQGQAREEELRRKQAEIVGFITVEFYTYENLLQKFVIDEDTDSITFLVEHEAKLRKHEQIINENLLKSETFKKFVEIKRKKIFNELDQRVRLKFNSPNPLLMFVKREADIIISDDEIKEGEEKK